MLRCCLESDPKIEMKWNSLEEEQCSIARTVAVIGDRWALRVLRDCFLRVDASRTSRRASE
jgi:DNA-binding HxlR family transcriptional regulator